MYEKSLFIFRRDLRTQDNNGLIQALRMSKVVLPCFIFDERQIGNHPYRSVPAFQFMIESLEDLENDLKKRKATLFFFKGISEKVIERLLKTENISAVFCNADYTPFSKERDMAIADVCKAHNVSFHTYDDCLILQPEKTLKPDGTPYTVFTPFYKRAVKEKVAEPVKNDYINYTSSCTWKDAFVTLKEILPLRKKYAVKGGREEALRVLENSKAYMNYKEVRDFPSRDATTKLSAHHKFGTVSMRESYHAIAKNCGTFHTLIQELFWHDFFTLIGMRFPHVYHKSFHEKYDKLKWEANDAYFKAWCEGKTGFPIVDAGMRQLNENGYMHNRVRMIVASFLTKDLLVDWRKGERYFAQKLIDYDPAVNNGNWQWAASTGCDAQPYFRIFNPWLQQQRFDKSCEYIKRWVPELRDILPEVIHEIY
ncbi:MAG: cryptochrome/photolyase family protein, partial [Candidatus Woesearchaeota archaeon]